MKKVKSLPTFIRRAPKVGPRVLVADLDAAIDQARGKGGGEVEGG